MELRIDPRTKNRLAARGKSVVRPVEGGAMAEKIGAWCYLECSAKTKEGLREVFVNAARAALGTKKRRGKKQ